MFGCSVVWTLVRDDGAEEIATVLLEYHTWPRHVSQHLSPQMQQERARADGDGEEGGGVVGDGQEEGGSNVTSKDGRSAALPCACKQGTECHVVRW